MSVDEVQVEVSAPLTRPPVLTMHARVAIPTSAPRLETPRHPPRGTTRGGEGSCPPPALAICPATRPSRWRHLLVDRSRSDHGRQVAAAQAAWLFIGAGVFGVAFDVLANRSGGHTATSLVLDASMLVVGIVVHRLPWHRWPACLLSVLPLVALTYLAIDRASRATPNESYGIWIVVVFVWIGVWQAPWSAVAMAPAAMAAYLVPVAFVGLPDGATLTAVAISVPLAVVVGETLARRTRAMKLADAQCRLAIEALANANLTDDLTGLGNRRQANLMLDRLQPGQALAILDLDHFKSVNDTLGHQRGDQVLIELGAFLSAELDGHQTVARYGGEEFIVVFADLDRNALDDLERLLASWRRRRPAATLSAGLALHHGTSWTDTFARADAALYVAKQAGRDRAVVADPLARAACSNAPLERPG